jgi:chloramphenicol-sensitive protein RarD
MSKYSGSLAATGSYILWGVLPVYWKSLETVPAYEILCHRMVWSLIFTLGLIGLMGRFRSFAGALRDLRTLGVFTCAALLLALNWLLYIWAVNAGYVIEASLGYFINPLISVLFGVVFLKEQLRRGQVAALVVAVCGVLYLTFWYGRFPWIALSLASSFGIYGLLHKKTSLPALDGLCLETLVLFLPAAFFLLYLEGSGVGSFGHSGLDIDLLLAGTGFVTSLPLLMFGFAAHRIPLSLLGLLQYIAPTINLVLGIVIYSEPFPPVRMIGFVIIWSALVLYVAEGMVQRARQKRILQT